MTQQEAMSEILTKINEKEGSWTLLKMTPSTTCILGVGTESKITLGTPI
jgi:hypothetical protein